MGQKKMKNSNRQASKTADPLAALAGLMSSLPDTAPAPKGAKSDKQAMNETYFFEEPSGREEARETMDELDAFEARLRGEAAPERRAAPSSSTAAPSGGRKPATTGAKKGSEYVTASVQTKRTSEEEMEAEDARNAVRDIDRFHGAEPDSP